MILYYSMLCYIELHYYILYQAAAPPVGVLRARLQDVQPEDSAEPEKGG